MEKILTFLNSPAGKGVLRHVLTVVGTLAVAKTWLDKTALDTLLAQFDNVAAAIGTILTVGATIWSVKSKKPADPAPPAPPTA